MAINLQADGDKITEIRNDDTELAVPGEVQDLFDELCAARNCRDRSIAAVFSARRALWFEKKAIKAGNRAWRAVYALWPQAREGSWTYYPEAGVLRRKDAEG